MSIIDIAGRKGNSIVHTKNIILTPAIIAAAVGAASSLTDTSRNPSAMYPRVNS